MKNFLRLKELYKLKEVLRTHLVSKDRNESSADHTYSCLILTKYFLPLVKEEFPNINEQKVFDLILFHDVVEIEAGDNPKTNPKLSREEQTKKEFEGMKKLIEKIPEKMGEEYEKLFKEFEKQETIEAKFARAIDNFDSIIQAIGFKDNWIKFKITEQKMHDWHRVSIYNFKAMKKDYDEITKYLEKEGYFWKE